MADDIDLTGRSSSDVFEVLDFRAELPCEGAAHGRRHAGPAVWVQVVHHERCGHTSRTLACEERRRFVYSFVTALCGGCAQRGIPLGEMVRFYPIPEAV